jgi:DNA primase large subunit
MLTRNDQAVAALHDAQDAAEDRIERAKEISDKIVRREIVKMLDDGKPIEEIFEALALSVEDALADETTRAVREGYEAARRAS